MNSRATLLAGLIAVLVQTATVRASIDGQSADQTDEVYNISSVGSIVLQPDGKILTSDAHGAALGIVDRRTGAFGRAPGGVFRFHPDGSLDHGFTCTAKVTGTYGVFQRSIALQPDGRVLIEGQPEQVIRLLPDGRLDHEFVIQAVETNVTGLLADPGALHPFAIGEKGGILIRGKGVEPDVGIDGGDYELPRPTVLRFDEAGRFLAWTPPGPVKTFAASLTHRGLLLCRSRFYPKTPYQAAAFTSLSPLPTPLEVQLALAGTTEAVQQVFEEVPLALCRYATRLPDGGAVVAMMERDGGRLVRFDRQWRVDWSFTNHFELRPLFYRISLAADSQSGVFLIGGFASLNGKPFTGIARVLPSGATDPRFYAQISLDRNLTLAALAVQKDGRVLIGGAFTEVNGTKCTSFARLNPDGSLDQEFRTRFDRDRYVEAFQRPRVASHSTLNISSASSSTAYARPATETPTSAPTSSSQASNSEQFIRITKLELGGDIVEIRFQAVPGGTYVLQARDSWYEAPWFNAATNITDTAGIGLLTDPSEARSRIRFYRVLNAP